MAKKKAKKCPFLKEQRSGKWTVAVCALPDGGMCPAPTACEQSPQYIEPEPPKEGADE